MPAASFSSRSGRRRAVSFGLAVAAHLLVVLLLLRLGPEPVQRLVEDAPLATFDVAPAPEDRPKPEPARVTAKTPRSRADAPSPAPAAPKATTPVTATKPPPMILLPGGMELFDAADIGKMHAAPGDGGDSDGAGDSVAAYGPGAGPGGQKLYNADWYRRPSDTELAGYMPAGGVPPAVERQLGELADDRVLVLAGELPVAGSGRQVEIHAGGLADQFQAPVPRDDRRVEPRLTADPQGLARAGPQQCPRPTGLLDAVDLPRPVTGGGQQQQVVGEELRRRRGRGRVGSGQRPGGDAGPCGSWECRRDGCGRWAEDEHCC